MAIAPMADRIWISRVSNLVLRMARHYGACGIRSIAALLLAAALSLAAAAASARPFFCVLVPHFKDEYWLSVGYGLEQEAARKDVALLFFEAGGYNARARQIEQLETCAARGVDAILIGAVTSDHPDLMREIARVAKGIPVFGLVNELHSDALSGRIGVDWRDMGEAVGRHLATLHPEGTAAKTAVFISGPSAAGWTAPLEDGLRRGLAGSAVTILEVFGADTGLRQQLAQVQIALDRYPDVDYLIGSAPAVEAAIGVLAADTGRRRPVLLSTYVSHTIKRGLMNGSVMAAPFDDPELQGEMAINQAVSGTSPGPSDRSAGPEVVLLVGRDETLVDVRVSPDDYFPTIQ